MRGGPLILQESPGKETEAELRAFDLRVLDDSSRPTTASKTHTSVYDVTICKVLVT